MGVYFNTKDGKQGMLDVAMFLRGQGLIPYKVQDGNVLFTGQNGEEGMFSIADWAVKNQYSVTQVDGFNTPPTALDIPPLNLTPLDQSVWYMDGAKVDALKELYAQATQLEDGRVVVLDKDGLWKTMWSDTWQAPEPYPSYGDRTASGEAVDTRFAMRSAGIAFLFGLSGVNAKTNKNGDLTPKAIEDMLTVLARNAPLETQMALAQIAEQTTGIDQWKFTSAINHHEDLGYWLNQLIKKSTFDFRMIQSEHAEMLVAALHKLAMKDFTDSMNALLKLEMADKVVINLRETAIEFISMLNSMDVIRDISKITGLDEWKELAKDAIDESKLPPMPSFVPRLVKLLQYIIPMAKDKSLMLAKGKRGLKAVISLMAITDSCLFSLSDVADSTAKQKMFMVLKTLQTRLEGKLAMTFHPIDNKDGSKVNAFMQAKLVYSDKRETVYKLIQTPKEMWSKSIINKLREEPNLEAFYDLIPPVFAKLVQSFVAMDTAYDMQPWVDTNYQSRILDSFALMQDTYGPPPPEHGYLANNSPRAALNIIDTLATAAGMIAAMDEPQRKQILRSPITFATMMKTIQTASIGREIGAVEILSKMGMGLKDPYASPNASQIWRDPNEVQGEQIAMEEQVAAFANKQRVNAEQQKLAQNEQMAQMQQNANQQPNAAAPGNQSTAPSSGAANGMQGMMDMMGQMAMGG